ncbi:hypothetical protein LUZ60_017656 [Juncus effusus]|nr:hypothetical protein LUZ60_017656 [Juncus effusus]
MIKIKPIFPCLKMKKAGRNFMASRHLVLLTGLFLMIGYLVLRPANQRITRLLIGGESGFVRDEDSGQSSATATATILQPEDRLLNGLLSPDFHNQPCRSRYQSAPYRKASPHIPSSHLISELRKYEALHTKCGPNTLLFNNSVEQLKVNNYSTDQPECNYIIWSPLGGIGNRMLTLASTFLYALLTDRVLLINAAKSDFSALFCEPFPNSTWIIPSNFPFQDLDDYNIDYRKSYGYLVKKKLIEEDPNVHFSSLPSLVYVHLQSDYMGNMYHERFFCDDTQLVLKKINWLVLKSDNYFLPGLFTFSGFEGELARMFPSKETVFHHLGRYLFHPSNPVWESATNFYDSHIANHEEIVGIQVRDFVWSKMSRDSRFDQIMNCTLKDTILPNNFSTSYEVSTKAILIISLHKEYFDKMKSYYERSHVVVHQPTHEEQQETEDHAHNEKALAEIYLLSFCDKLVTSAWSTFGYVSYSLAGIRPWILLSSKVATDVNPSCRKVMTIDPCFHSPPKINCKTKRNSETSMTSPHLRQCEDVDEGIKLIN